MKLPKSLQNLINTFERLPGIGPKTAARLAFYLWQTPDRFIENFAKSLVDLKKNTKECPICFNLDEQSPCSICSDKNRDHSIICVVEKPLDIVALEAVGQINGLYHCLGGLINPLDHIGPEDLQISSLITRIKNSSKQHQLSEVILATNPTIEGEATAMLIVRKIKESVGNKIKVTRLGQGLPTGADLDYADAWTLRQAWENRRQLKDNNES